MANSSPPSTRPQRETPSATRSQRLPFSGLPDVSDFLSDTRNSPEAHRRNFHDAQREHQRVLEAALHVYELHQLAEANRQIEEEELRRRELVAEEERRIGNERQAKIKQLEDEARLAAQKAAPIPKPTIPAVLPPVTDQAEAHEEVPGTGSVATAEVSTKSKTESIQGVEPNSLWQDNPKSTNSLVNTQAGVAHLNKQPQTQVRSSFLQPGVRTPFVAIGQPTTEKTNSATDVANPSLPTPQDSNIDRHIQIHKNLKGLRKFVVEQAKTNISLKQHMGEMRRAIRKSFGQLTSGGLKENKIPVARLVTVLASGLKDVPSELLDPNQFLLEPRNAPVEGASHNEPRLPSLYLYLLNIMAKAAISQFINESGADTRTAEAIGQAVVKVYSENEFIWRGKPMIDMLIAKYRVVCPVLFGIYGNDRTEQGRSMVGWKKENGRWISEQYHMDRMTGLGAGFAALTLRDFSRVKRPNPWPPTVYWMSLAKIVNTPPEGMSETQCYVLKAMIANNEARFMAFYGNAAVAALRCALVDYPARASKPTTGTETLKVLAKSIAMKTGLNLETM